MVALRSAFLLSFEDRHPEKIMQLLGNTEKEKQAYKQALIEAKRGGAFDLATFNNRWLEEHPEAMTAGEDENQTHVRKILDRENSNVCSSIPTGRQMSSIERVQGEVLDPDDIGGAGDELREVVREIVQAIEAYKIENNIVRFSKEKNGIILLRACFDKVCSDVVKPSRILKRKPYEVQKIKGSPLSNNNAFNGDMLLRFIDITKLLAGREGYPFTRALYMALTGISYDFLRGGLDYLTSSRIGLYEKVLNAEYSDSLNFASGSEIGNIRNLNEDEAKINRDQGAGVASVGLGELKRLGGN